MALSRAKKFKYDEWNRQYLRETWSQRRAALLTAAQPIRQPLLLGSLTA
ncbi:MULTISPECIES: hypothetical protein [Trichocoleus]|uniref:Uncharacterized protein n=1 Tax=Trichocoleus desertorum GB2-A4 TaxID=2933944 RepID=A0ABV0JA58_9CYAN|nr:hypothetical protein [Trichocoleus sp. FACHB-46]MBD1862863.1 hypothetical protein [Trichocoleus sp. FACHB-46]